MHPLLDTVLYEKQKDDTSYELSNVDNLRRVANFDIPTHFLDENERNHLLEEEHHIQVAYDLDDLEYTVQSAQGVDHVRVKLVQLRIQLVETSLLGHWSETILIHTIDLESDLSPLLQLWHFIIEKKHCQYVENDGDESKE